MGSESSKEKHFSREEYPYGRSSYTVEDLLQSSAFTTWKLRFEQSDVFQKYQTLPEKLPMEVERDLLDRLIKDHIDTLAAEVKQQFNNFTEPKSSEFVLMGKPLLLNFIRLFFRFIVLYLLLLYFSIHFISFIFICLYIYSSSTCQIFGPPRTKKRTLVGEMNENGSLF